MGAYLPGTVVLKGHDVIYPPKGQAGEYAPLATNPYVGCGHKCFYCYVPNAMHLQRKDFDKGAALRPGYLERLRKDAIRYQFEGITEQVFITFSSDPYHAGDTAPTRKALEILTDAGLGFCTLSKGGVRALRDIDLFRRDRDAYAATLTCTDDAFSLKYERGAPPTSDRIAALKAFHARGIFTWVSLEPTLSVEASLELVRKTHGFVDLYKVGKANYVKTPEPINWREYTERMVAELNRVGARHYIKLDLQPFLPEGYGNPLRVPQHHGRRPIEAGDLLIAG